MFSDNSFVSSDHIPGHYTIIIDKMLVDPFKDNGNTCKSWLVCEDANCANVTHLDAIYNMYYAIIDCLYQAGLDIMK